MIIGALLVLPSTSYSIPDYTQAAIRQPLIEVFTEQPDQPVLAVADFENPNDYSVAFYPESLASFKAQKPLPVSVHANPVHLWIQISSPLAPFTWMHPYRMTNITVATKQNKYVSSLTRKTTDYTRWAGFQVILNGKGSAPSIDFSPSANSQSTNGPYFRVALPQIDVSEDAYSGGTVIHPGNIYAPLDKIDNVHLYAPSLNVWVDTSPFEQLNSNLEAVHVVPTPSNDIPLSWEGDRFVSDLLYRDANWDHTAALKIFFGGLASGIGVSLVAAPIALLASDPRRKAEPGTTGTSNKARPKVRNKARNQ
jgi:hypothetical protein